MASFVVIFGTLLFPVTVRSSWWPVGMAARRRWRWPGVTERMLGLRWSYWTVSDAAWQRRRAAPHPGSRSVRCTHPLCQSPDDVTSAPLASASALTRSSTTVSAPTICNSLPPSLYTCKKVAHTRLPSVWFRSWSRFLAVSPVTWQQFEPGPSAPESSTLTTRYIYNLLTYDIQPFNGTLSRTTRVGQYQKRPTHTHPDHWTSFINFFASDSAFSDHCGRL